MSGELFQKSTGVRYVRVIPEVSLDRQFDYVLPEHLAGQVEAGHKLRVPWGPRTCTAYAVSFPEKPEVDSCREVLEIIGCRPLVPPALVNLSRWMADYYCCDFATVFKGMLPAVLRKKDDGSRRQLWVEVPEHLRAEEVLPQLKGAKAQRKAWECARDSGGGWLADLQRISGTSAAPWKALADRGFLLLFPEKVERDPLSDTVEANEGHDLNPEQQVAVDMILAETRVESPKPILLQGVTGSGKTEVYLQAMSRVLDAGKNALVLVPEIALTPQTIRRFRARFEGRAIRLAVLHSRLSDGERHDQWHAIREGKARVVIGARSAVFAPVENLGLIVVDEEHENGYKQEETPRYQARDVAVVRGKLEKVPVVLGSATPSLESVQNAKAGKYLISKLSTRPESVRLPVMHVVDLRKETPEGSGRVLLSEALKRAVTDRLEKKEQVILFLNRRGFATSLQCPKCGHVEECPHCAVPLTYHRSDHSARCHLCDHHHRVKTACPECSFDQYRYSGAGTQRIEDAVARAFPQARWQRMDSDTMRGKDAYTKALEAFQEGKTDILVGTQMIAKGLHFPNVTCVGIIACDQALQMPDFRAAERVFQQLVQVAGRAGRGDKPGEVFLQTYTPFHDAIQFARHHDVEGFLETELEYRESHKYPPFRRGVLITFRGRSEEKTKFCIETAARKLKEILKGKVEVPEPSPAPVAKIRDHFRYHLFLLTDDILPLSRVLRREVVDQEWPDGVRAVVDIDPFSLL